MKKLFGAMAVVVLAITGYLTWHFLTTPKYGWLVFGPEGKVRVLLRSSINANDLDLNRNGRFEAAERFKVSSAEPLSIPISDGKTSYLIRKMSSYEYEGRRNTTVEVEVTGQPGFRQLGDLFLSRTRAGAPIAHFNGPLEVQAQTILWELPKDLALRRGDKGTDIRVNIGTIRKDQQCWTTVYTQDRTNAFFPTNVFPWVEVEFPNKTNSAAIVERYALDKVC
jgi:hypothetical protein